MVDKKYILFDLDGTLTDSKVGIVKSIQYSLQEFGINVENADDFLPFIGPPLRDSYRKHYGFNDEEIERAALKFREYFTETGIFENTLFDGVDALLAALQSAGKQVILATSKPLVHAEIILKHFEIEKYFSFVAGSELDGSRAKKNEVIEFALESMRITDIENAVMVGDREHDVIGAQAFGMDCIGVLYGYGSLQELTDAGAACIAKNIDELGKLII